MGKGDRGKNRKEASRHGEKKRQREEKRHVETRVSGSHGPRSMLNSPTKPEISKPKTQGHRVFQLQLRDRRVRVSAWSTVRKPERYAQAWQKGHPEPRELWVRVVFPCPVGEGVRAPGRLR